MRDEEPRELGHRVAALGLQLQLGHRLAASRQVVYEEDRRAILSCVALQAAIIATSMVASGLGGASVLAIASRLM